MKVNKTKYNEVKGLLQLGLHNTEVASITELSSRTIERIRRSTSLNDYHEISHNDVPAFYKETKKFDILDAFFIGVGALTIVALVIVTITVRRSLEQ